MENSYQSIDINKMDEKQSLYVIWQMLNKAQSKGIYTIDESCAIKAAIQKITQTLEKSVDKESKD